MDKKFTPGPWTQGHSPAGITCVWLDGSTEPLHEMGRCTSWIDCNTEANARLIAAAPDLLEVLEEITEKKGKRWHPTDPLAKRAREVIAKALGG